uniref:Uncharacterized protein n=1 Tax=Opuntia streptacantha TaxID=393608 RepID=A0A7C8YQL2_OPUST
MRVDKFGPLSSNNNITSKRNLKPSGHRKPCDGAHDRFPAPLHLRHRITLHIFDVAFEHVLRSRQVNAGAEGPTRTRQDDDPNRVVGGEAFEGLRHLPHHRPRQRV